LGLLVTTPEDVKLFALNAGPENLTNCSSRGLPKSIMDNGDDITIAHEQTISVPASVEGSIKIDPDSDTVDPKPELFDRVGIQTPGGQTISIRVTPTTPDDTEDTSWRLILQDPSGTEVYEVDFHLVYHGPTTPPTIQNVFLACSGTYAFYIRPTHPDGYGTAGQVFHYQVAIERGSVSAATPGPSPAPR
jgi:hypothetical protein